MKEHLSKACMPGRTYKIGEAAQLLNLKSYVLRFWETEFPKLTPLRTEKGQRLYSESDLELLKFIRHLLHERGLTIEGARKVLQNRAEGGDTSLTSELLDEGYKNFGGEVFLEPLDDTAPPTKPGELESSTQLAAKSAAKTLLLDYTLQELKNIEALLQNPNRSG